MTTVSGELLEILACPKCKAPVAEVNGNMVCSGPECGLRFPVRDGIPIMLIEEATTVGIERKGEPAP